MKKVLFSIIAGVASTAIFAQTGPGGVSSGLKVWLRADSLVTLNPSSTGGTSVTSWGNIANPSEVFDTTSSGTRAPQANAATGTKYITFSGTTVLADSLATINDLDGTSYDCFIVYHQSGGNGSILYVGPRTPVGYDNIGWGNANSAIFLTPTAGGGGYITANVSNTDIPQTNPEIYNWNCSAPTGTESVVHSTNYSLNGGGNIIGTGGNGGTAFEGVKPVYGNINAVPRPAATAGEGLIAIGANKSLTGGYTSGGGTQVYEIVLYNRKLSLAERQQVYSYLAMKYNITLAITSNPASIADTGYTTQNGTYFASDGTPVFQRDNIRTSDDTKDSFYLASSATVYSMGRDDADGLHSVGNNAYGTYIETGAKQNFTNDKAFFFMTSNNASNAANTDLTTYPVPAGANIIARSPKIWKMTATNVNDIFKFVPSLGSGYGSTSASNDSLLLLVSSTPAFATNDTKGFKTSGRVFTGSGFAYWDQLDPAKVFGSTTSPVTKYFAVALLDGTTSALPLGLTNFTATLQNNSVLLGWNSNVETGVASYTVQRSVNGQWSDIATVATKGDNQHYAYTDASPVSGVTNSYRIKETDIDGKVFYSEVKYADLKNNKVLADLKAFPNPTSGIVHLTSETSTIDTKTIAVFDVAGSYVPVTATADGTGATIDLSRNASGIYFIRANGHVVKVLKK